MTLIKNLFIILCIFMFLSPNYLAQIDEYKTIFNIFNVSLCILLIIMYLFKGRFSYFITSIIFFFIVRIMVTVFQDGYLHIILGTAVPVIGLCILGELLIKIDPKLFLNNLNLVLSCLVYINLISMIIYPNGLYTDGTIPAYFIGHSNAFSVILIPAIAVSVVNSMFLYNKLNVHTKILITAVFISAVLAKSATFLVGVLLSIIYLMFIHRKKISKLINFKIFVIFYAVIFIGITIFDLQTLFAFFIEGYLGKSITLSNRVYIWDIAYSLIRESLWFGYGGIEGGRYVWISNENAFSAHNLILQLLLESGLVGLMFFVFIFISPGKNMIRYKKNYIANTLVFFIFTMLFMFLSEAQNDLTLMFVLLLLASRLELLENKKQISIVNSNIKHEMVKL